VSEWEACPLLEKTIVMLEESGEQEQIESVRKKLDSLYEKKPIHA
jgi:hypothetical protein